MPNTKGRPSKIAGKKLYANVETNPRREGTHGYNTWKLIHENPGITVEELVASGGRVKDVNWDLEKQNVRTEAPDTENA
jgi:hypothetical protein